MSRVEHRKRTTIRHEYLIPKPAMYGDIKDALYFALQDLQGGEVKDAADDAVQISNDEDHIIVWWEETT